MALPRYIHLSKHFSINSAIFAWNSMGISVLSRSLDKWSVCVSKCVCIHVVIFATDTTDVCPVFVYLLQCDCL